MFTGSPIDDRTPKSERLTKLVLLLGSDKDGEAPNAARSIGRALKDAGCDWHHKPSNVGLDA